MKTQRFLALSAICLLMLGLVLLNASSAFYAFVFAPDHHGSWREALKQGLFDFEAWWAFTKTTPGLIMRGGGLVSILGAALCMWLASRSD
jgi:hypothetical protein